MDELTPYNFMQKTELPPSSNRGAINTSESGLIALVDWLQVTFKNEILLLKIFDVLGMDKKDFTEINGLYGYRQGYTFNGIFIFYQGFKLDMGIHLQITGTGCRFLEQIDDFDWIDFFRKIDRFREYNVTRLDIALDDFQGIFTIEQIIRKVKRRELASRFPKTRRIETLDNSTGMSEGKTLYWGRPTSRLQIRMYEKNHERRNKGVDHDYEIWNRTELQLRKERAKVMFNILLNKTDSDFANEVKSVLKHYLRFLVRGKDTNRNRWKTWTKWEKFLGEVDRIKLTISKPEKDLIDSYIHMEKQYSATLAMLDEAGLDINDLIEIGKEKMKEKHKQKIREYKKSPQGALKK